MQRNKYVDMHIHSTYSDGDCDLDELVKRIIDANIGLFSLTDHDTNAGNVALLQNEKLMKSLKINDVKFVTGIELSCVHNGISCHILGFNYDVNSPSILSVIDKVKALRKDKIKFIVEELKEKFDIEIPENEVEELLKQDNPGKPHLARIMMKYNLVSDWDSCFKDYLKKIKTPNFKVDAKEGIQAIHKAGGIAVLAHPIELRRDYGLSYDGVDNYLNDLVKFGLDGLEVHYNLHTSEDIEVYTNMAYKYDLIVSTGSDFHGPQTKPKVFLTSVGNNEKLTIEEFSKEKTVLDYIH